MKTKIKLTIFTPAYNRAHTLKRCYESIVQQDFSSLEWLVINDGSTDDTDIVIKNLQKENKISIRYFKQDNKGKQASWNKAVLEAQGQFFMGLDSDDALIKNSLSQIFVDYENILTENYQIIGMRCLTIDAQTKKISGSPISQQAKISSWFYEFSHKKLFGERIDIFKAKYLNSFLYPVSNDIKFIPEIWFYAEVSSQNYTFLYVPQVLLIFHTKETQNRLSKSTIKEHAMGHYLARANALQKVPFWVWLKNPLTWLKTIIRFSQTATLLQWCFSQRKQDTSFFYGFTSYLLSWLLPLRKE